MIKQVTEAGLVDLLMSMSHGASFATIRTATEPKMRKTGNPFVGRIVKLSTVNTTVSFHYDNGVLRRLEKEGKSPDDFKRGESWHTPVFVDGKLTPLCRSKSSGELYLRVMVNDFLSSSFVDSETGAEIPRSEVEPFLTESKSYQNQGLDEPLRILTYKVASITAITVNGCDFIVAR